MPKPFDQLVVADMRNVYSDKWWVVEQDELPLSVADMDLPIASEISAALIKHIKDGTLMYSAKQGIPGLKEVVANRLAMRYGWVVGAEQIQPLSATVPGLFLSVSAVTKPGDGVIVQTPVYTPFFEAIEYTGRKIVPAPLSQPGYRVNRAALEQAWTPEVKALLICNPHNPVGRVFTETEIEILAAFALEKKLWVISDELHADLVLDGNHLPLASVSSELAQRTVTLYGPTKAFNFAGLKISFAITANRKLSERMKLRARGSAEAPNTLAQTAALAAYTQADPWLINTLDYLRQNRKRIGEVVAKMPDLDWTPPEGTFLAWLDFRKMGLDDPAQNLRELTGLVLERGARFEQLDEGRGFARLNFGTSRPILDTALGRLQDAAETIRQQV
jgi:cystathionine beta-lyase